ncbi:MAG TPA: SAM-dependent methyltransferase [Thermoanaerobaculia bacterium]|nr:SAM-dependent methyltransferase [Thermoanaerobaculia bacterium]
MRDEPSATARFVAEHILLLGSRIHALLGVPREQIEWTARVLEASGWSLGVVSSWRSTLVERFSIPGIRTHYVLRKKIIEREVLQAIDEGCRQVVVVGAGFDVLPFRLAAEFPLVTFIELDHAATQNAKRVVAERYGSRIEFVGSDLRNEPIDVAVKRVAFDAEKRTAFVVEGVLMYFGEEQVIAILQSIRRAAKAGRLIVTAMESDRFAGSTWLAEWWLKRRGEPFRWAVTPGAVNAFLAPLGFQVLRVYGATEIRAELPAAVGQRPVAAGELIVIAEW